MKKLNKLSIAFIIDTVIILILFVLVCISEISSNKKKEKILIEYNKENDENIIVYDKDYNIIIIEKN